MDTMGKINILLANAGSYFTDDEIGVIKDSVRKAELYISSRFDEFDYSIDLIVARSSFMQGTIPEDGICGRTFSSKLLTVVINKQQSPVSADSIYETTCHELSHSLRWEKVPEYTETLFDDMILEGLAVALEEQAVKDAKVHKRQFFLQSMLDTSQDEYAGMIEALQSSFSNTEFNYGELFYSGNDSLTRWAGYRLGYFYVKRYLEATGRTIEQATMDSYKDFRKII